MAFISKNKIASNDKRTKWVFAFQKIWQIFEAFHCNISSSTNLFLFLKSEPFIKLEQNSDQDFNLTKAVDEVFSKKAKLGRPPKIHQCKMCHKIVKTRQQLIIHVQIVHCTKKDQRCHICDKGKNCSVFPFS